MKREDWGNPYNEDTAAVYNANCKKGEDPAFGKVNPVALSEGGMYV
jgi:hypothetical protein